MVKRESRRIGLAGEDAQGKTKWKLGVASWCVSQ